MKLKQSVNLLLIALFVWASQSATIHYQQHAIEEAYECKVCHIFEQMELLKHNIPVVMVNENLAVKTKRDVKKVVVNFRFDYDVVPQFKLTHSIVSRHDRVKHVPLGFDATGPPFIFS